MAGVIFGGNTGCEADDHQNIPLTLFLLILSEKLNRRADAARLNGLFNFITSSRNGPMYSQLVPAAHRSVMQNHRIIWIDKSFRNGLFDYINYVTTISQPYIRLWL